MACRQIQDHFFVKNIFKIKKYLLIGKNIYKKSYSHLTNFCGVKK